MSAALDGCAGEPPASPYQVGAQALAARPDLSYLFFGGPVRDATEAEAAEYAARRDMPDWQDLYAPAEPHVTLPVSAEVAGLTDAAQEPAETPAEPGEAPVLGDITPEQEAAFTRLMSAHDIEDASTTSVLDLDEN